MTFSIIVPHKNAPQLLARLYETIPQREDTEVIIIDDCSDSSLVDIDNFPGRGKPRTQCVFLNEGKGAGYARNIGIEKATGKWLLFADADDSFTENLPLVLDKYASDEETDMVILNAQQVDEKGIISSLRLNLYINNYLKHRFYSEKVLRYGFWTPWSRMVKKSLVDDYNLRYEEVPTGNDMMFCLRCSQYAKTIAVESNIIYNYLKPTGRSVTNGLSKEISSLKPKVDRTFRRLELYREVEYFFKPDHIRARYNARRIDKSYFNLYNKLLREHSYSNFQDIYNFLVFRIGEVLRIV